MAYCVGTVIQEMGSSGSSCWDDQGNPLPGTNTNYGSPSGLIGSGGFKDGSGALDIVSGYGRMLLYVVCFGLLTVGFAKHSIKRIL